jgi:dihydrofolate reductase
MSKLYVRGFSVSLDGFGAGPDQSLDQPLGIGGKALHDWAFGTRTFQRMFGESGGAEDGIDEAYAARSMDGIGAWILGRNMFGPIRGDWPDHSWQGWWGPSPPYHTPVFVLTHYERPSIEMEGGTVFHFVTEGAEAALQRARAAAGDKDIRVGGGPATIRQYLLARQIDELHLAVAPVLLGRGEPLFAGLDLLALGYRVAAHENSDKVMHLTIRRMG